MATLDKVQAQIAKLQAQAEALVAKQSSGVIAKIRDIMEKHGLTTADIEPYVSGAKKRGPKPGAKAAAKAASSVAKYQDPKTGATWTGHGRAPTWIANAKDRTKFLINATGATASKPKAAAKASGKAALKGKLPPKYRNPKTGETWSGHARPPAWIKDVKDRSKFLIAGGAEAIVAATTGTASKGVVAVKKASAKKVAAKKTTAKKVVVKKAIVKEAVSTKTSASRKAPAKKGTAKKPVPAASKKASTNKVSMTEAAGTAPVATVESGVELTT